MVENSQLDEKPPENEQGGATEEVKLWSQKPNWLHWKIQATLRSGKPLENDQGGATEETIPWSQKPSCLCWKI